MTIEAAQFGEGAGVLRDDGHLELGDGVKDAIGVLNRFRFGNVPAE